jgi:hypothetical protein
VHAQVSFNRASRLVSLTQVKFISKILVRAWLFSAGLILGFTIFVHATRPPAGVETAFSASLCVMKELGRTSLQAQHYYEVLQDMHDAIKKHQERLAPPFQPSGSHFLSRIMVIEEGNSLHTPPSSMNEPTPSYSPSIPALRHLGSDLNTIGATGYWNMDQGPETCPGSSRNGDFSTSGNNDEYMGDYDYNSGLFPVHVTENALYKGDNVADMTDFFKW